MKLKTMAVAIFVTAWPAFGQQSGTTTKCEESINGMTCKTTPNPPTLAEILRPKKHTDQPQTVVAAAPSGLSPEAVKEILAEEKKARDAKDTVDFIYCRQNPKGSLTDYEGKLKACADVIEYAKAFCLVNPEVERCTLARSKAEVERAFAALGDGFNNDPRRNKKDQQRYFDWLFAKLTKWGCMSFPDMTLPQRDGTLHPCPNAPEPTPLHADAGSQKK
jgi:sarcosine oxidase delta subunit